jgi:hypothetical protein
VEIVLYYLTKFSVSWILSSWLYWEPRFERLCGGLFHGLLLSWGLNGSHFWTSPPLALPCHLLSFSGQKLGVLPCRLGRSTVSSLATQEVELVGFIYLIFVTLKKHLAWLCKTDFHSGNEHLVPAWYVVKVPMALALGSVSCPWEVLSLKHKKLRLQNNQRLWKRSLCTAQGWSQVVALTVPAGAQIPQSTRQWLVALGKALGQLTLADIEDSEGEVMRSPQLHTRKLGLLHKGQRVRV